MLAARGAIFSAAKAATEVRNSSMSWPSPKSKSNMLNPGWFEPAFSSSVEAQEIPYRW
jgi:hypothetical protein